MNFSSIRRVLGRVFPAAAALLLLAAGACNKGGDGGPAQGAQTPAGGGSKTFSMALTVNPPDANNRRAASVRFEAGAPMPEGQLAFELPADCSVVAGALVRQVKNLGQGKSVSQELTFECKDTAAGVVKVKFTGAGPDGKPLEKTAEAPL